MCITEYDEEKTLRLTFEEGKEEGRKEGKEEGRREGKEEGRKVEKREIVIKMIKKNVPYVEIADICGITVEQVEAIAAEMSAA